MKLTDVSSFALVAALTDLADAAALARQKNPSAVSSVCAAVANIIASVPFGSTNQQHLMDAATKVGFNPYYYVNTIRVEWPPTREPRTKAAKEARA